MFTQRLSLLPAFLLYTRHGAHMTLTQFPNVKTHLFPGNESLFYDAQGQLTLDGVRLSDIGAQEGTPTYAYSERRIVKNYGRIRRAFAEAGVNAEIHYSAKANGNLHILRTLVQNGAGVDTVSGGEIFRALKAGAKAQEIVFAGVGKTEADLRYALEQGVGWFNIENVAEADLINQLAGELRMSARVALRFNPDVAANTHRHIATGHEKAKFGLNAEQVQHFLDHQRDYANLRFEGVHIHIGSQLHDTTATAQAVRAALELIVPYPAIRTLNIGGGFPAAYTPDEPLPNPADFARALAPMLRGYQVILEPGRGIIADAGVLLTRVLYRKQVGGEPVIILDAGMTNLIRPMLYDAHHEIVPLVQMSKYETATIVGPICESTDVFARDRKIARLQPGDGVAILTAGAYGNVMASNYNGRGRPGEVMINADGQGWRTIRRRETWDDLIALELV